MKQMKLNGSKFDNVLIDISFVNINGNLSYKVILKMQSNKISSNEFMIMHQSKENRLLK